MENRKTPKVEDKDQFARDVQTFNKMPRETKELEKQKDIAEKSIGPEREAPSKKINKK